MNKEDREKLKGTIVLLDMATYNLSKALAVIELIKDDEVTAVEELEDSDNDKALKRRDECEDLESHVAKLEEVIEDLGAIKEFLEAF